MSDSEATHEPTDPNEFEISPAPTAEEKELGRLMLEHVRRNPPQKEAEQ